MTSDDKSFIKDNRVRLSKIFKECLEAEELKVFQLPQGEERDTQILFVNFLKSWLYTIEIFSKKEKKGEKNFI